jgi:succinate dehydrogenase / fumarate reductase cytochrome b subunit
LSTAIATASLDRHFILRKLHSLTGVVPIGAFLLEHFFTNSYALSGPAAFDRAVEDLLRLPYVVWIEWLVILLPILFHGVYGLVITASAKPNAGSYGYVRNWLYFFQRVTGVVAFVFIFFHLLHFRFSGERPDFAQVARLFENPAWVVFYALGVLSVVYHFANGLWLFLINWGITIGERAQRVSAWACAGIGIVLLVVGLRVIRAFLA